MQEEAIKAAKKEYEYKAALYEKQCNFEKQRANDEFEEFLDSQK